MRKTFILLIGLACLAGVTRGAESSGETVDRLFARDNLVAWCIVPFDASGRNPQQRAAMVARLGLRKVAYDWREQHVAMFEEEVLAYRKHGLDFFAFWSWHDAMAPIIRRHGIHPQIWLTNPSPIAESHAGRVERAVAQLKPIVEKAAQLECQVGLYNHGGWGGEAENLIAVCQAFRRQGHDHVGIVFNFHHAHDQIDDFGVMFPRLLPYLICLNLNGMNDQARPKILPLGQGEREEGMLRIVIEHGYEGPLGILDHRPELDSQQALQENLDGLRELTRRLRTSK